MINKRNILVGVTAIAVVLSTGIIAFAATDTAGTQPDKQRPAFTENRPTVMSDLTDTQREAVRQAGIDSAKAALTELVAKGVLTQDEADKLSEIKTMSKERISKDDSGFGALTQEQRTALKEEEQAVFKEKIAGLVDDGTLTQDQVNQLEPGHKMMAANLTDDQRKAVMEAKAAAMKEAAANLVKNGTLTQEEADALAAVPAVKPVEKGDFNTLTEEQKTALNEAMKEKWKSALTDLVSNGTLTQDQADQLRNDKTGFHMGFAEGPGFKGHSGFEGHPGFDGHPGFNGRPDSDGQAAEEQDTSL